jgi:hypothetical protein
MIVDWIVAAQVCQALVAQLGQYPEPQRPFVATDRRRLVDVA